MSNPVLSKVTFALYALNRHGELTEAQQQKLDDIIQREFSVEHASSLVTPSHVGIEAIDGDVIVVIMIARDSELLSIHSLNHLKENVKYILRCIHRTAYYNERDVKFASPDISKENAEQLAEHRHQLNSYLRSCRNRINTATTVNAVKAVLTDLRKDGYLSEEAMLNYTNDMQF